MTGWTYYGCQTEATNARALSSKSTAYDTMTLESCASDCAGYTYFGTEYGRECDCTSSLSSFEHLINEKQVIAEMLSALDRWSLPLQTAALHAEAMPMRNVEREIVSRSTRRELEAQLQELPLQRQGALQLRHQHQDQLPRRPVCQLAGHIPDVFSKLQSYLNAARN